MTTVRLAFSSAAANVAANAWTENRIELVHYQIKSAFFKNEPVYPDSVESRDII